MDRRRRELSGRDPHLIKLVETYAKEQGMFRTDQSPDPIFTDTLELDLATVVPSISGPRRPQDRIALTESKKAFKEALPSLIKSGGSIPVAGLLKSQLGLETIFMGFGLDDDRVHSPNEKFELDCYRMGVRSHANLIAELWAMTEG